MAGVNNNGIVDKDCLSAGKIGNSKLSVDAENINSKLSADDSHPYVRDIY